MIQIINSSIWISEKEQTPPGFRRGTSDMAVMLHLKKEVPAPFSH